jgi:hypothetical protein
VAKYGIFSGCFGDDDAMWVESVEELETAVDRTNEIATEQPGKHFIFSPCSKEVVASIDTTEPRVGRWMVPPVV